MLFSRNFEESAFVVNRTFPLLVIFIWKRVHHSNPYMPFCTLLDAICRILPIPNGLCSSISMTINDIFKGLHSGHVWRVKSFSYLYEHAPFAKSLLHTNFLERLAKELCEQRHTANYQRKSASLVPFWSLRSAKVVCKAGKYLQFFHYTSSCFLFIETFWRLPGPTWHIWAEYRCSQKWTKLATTGHPREL